MSATTLNQADLEALQTAMETLTETVTLPKLRQQTVELVAGLVTAHRVTWNEIDVHRQRMVTVYSRTPVPEADLTIQEIKERFLAHAHEHPVIEYFERTRDGRPYALSDFLSRRELHATGLYRELYAHLGTEDQLSFVLPHPRMIVGVAVSRTRRGFSARDRTLCNLLRPHILLAYRQISGDKTTALTDDRLLEDLTRMGLTPREADVIAAISRGMSTKETAGELQLSPRTVDKHVAHALDKLGVRTRIEALALLRYGKTRHLVSSPNSTTRSRGLSPSSPP